MTTPIRKSLLTPYRRIGLSRNRKAANNGSFISPFRIEDIKLINDGVSPINAPISKLKSYDEASSTSITCRQKQDDQSVKVNIEDSNASRVLKESKNKIKAKKDDSNKKTNKSVNDDSKIKNITESNTMKANERKKQDNKRKAQGRGICENMPELKNDDKTNMAVENNNANKSDSLQESDIANGLKQNRKIKTKGRKYVSDSDDDDSDFSGFPSSGSSSKSMVEENSKNDVFEIKKRKRINIIDSQGSDNSENDIKMKTNFKNELVNGKIIENDITNLIIEPKIKPKSNKTIKRKFSLSLKKSVSNSSMLEEEEILSEKHEKSDSNALANKEHADIIEEIIKLEKTVQNKEDQLHKLKQAEIYRNLHKLGDLKSESDVWKSGCKTALRDLLKHLNQHNTIDMNTMLTNLKIPQNIFKYDADNDCFY